MLRIMSLTKSYKTKVLDDLTVDFLPQGVTVIVGLNGSGKTTLLDCIATLRVADGGTITLNECDSSTVEYKENLFYVPSEFYLPNYMTGMEYLEFVLARYDRSNKEGILLLLNIFDLEQAKDKLLETYSYGMKKKIQLIAALLANTQYILGDELFSGLDFETILLALALIEKKAKTTGVILVSHNKLIIERFCERILVMQNGRLTQLAGGVEQLEETVLNMEVVHDKIQTIQKYFSSN